MIKDFDYHLFGTHVRFGDGVAARIDDELSALELARPVVLSQSRMAATTSFQMVMAALGKRAVLQETGIPAHSSVMLVEDIARRARDFRPDCIVAVGGGSVADSAKALAMLLSEGGSLSQHTTAFTPPAHVEIPRRNHPKLPIIAIPTTASGAETTSSFGVRDEHGEKLMFWNRHVSATSLLIDPLLSRDIPMGLMRETAMNGIAHCLEGLYSTGRSIVSDGLALQALALFAQALDGDGQDEATQRRALLAAGHLAGMVLAMARSCLHHAICHVIGAHTGAGHGAVNTVMLPHTIRFNAETSSAQLAPALETVNRHVSGPHDTLWHWVSAVRTRHDLPASLRAFGLDEQDLPHVARAVMKERGLALNPRRVDNPEAIERILQAAL